MNLFGAGGAGTIGIPLVRVHDGLAWMLRRTA